MKSLFALFILTLVAGTSFAMNSQSDNSYLPIQERFQGNQQNR